MTAPLGDTADLRSGAPLHDGLLALLPLVGVWQGSGQGIRPADGDSFRYAQQVSFVHDGRPFLAYSSATWLIDESGSVIRPAAREAGFWRPGAGPDEIEVVLALNTGLTVVLTGHAGEQRWEVASSAVLGTPTAKPVDAERRLYALVDGALAYAQELAPAGRALAPHLQATLTRVPADRS
jgi:hypothetical protein